MQIRLASSQINSDPLTLLNILRELRQNIVNEGDASSVIGNHPSRSGIFSSAHII